VESAAPEVILPTMERRLAPARDPVQRFINEARRYARLDEKQERELIRAARERGDVDAARTLVLHNLRLVVSIAYQYRRPGSICLTCSRRAGRFDGGRAPLGSGHGHALRVLCGLLDSRLHPAFPHDQLAPDPRGQHPRRRKLFFRLEKERQKLLAEGIDPRQAAGSPAGSG